MAESFMQTAAGSDDVYKNYDTCIADLERSVVYNEKEYVKCMLVMRVSSKKERKFYERQAKQMDWNIRQGKAQVAHKKLEKQIIRMLELKTFILVRDQFLKRYDEMSHAMFDIWEEGVSIDEMTESDYRESLELVMSYRNYFHEN